MMALSDTKSLIATVVATAVILITISTTTAQIPGNYYPEKPGSCGPELPVQICNQLCYIDGQCRGDEKCCPTSCGGTICARPVTMRRPRPILKGGSCPVIPTGRWVCTSTCSSDNDCPGIRKCCKNRCGAMACQKPETEPVDSPFGMNPDEQPPVNPYVIYSK